MRSRLWLPRRTPSLGACMPRRSSSQPAPLDKCHCIGAGVRAAAGHCIHASMMRGAYRTLEYRHGVGMPIPLLKIKHQPRRSLWTLLTVSIETPQSAAHATCSVTRCSAQLPFTLKCGLRFQRARVVQDERARIACGPACYCWQAVGSMAPGVLQLRLGGGWARRTACCKYA
jgi:hypothetical protein